MTLGLFLPLITALGALLAVPLFLWQLRRLPDPMSPDYDEATVGAQARRLRLLIAVEIALPVLLYLIFNLIVPEEGSLVLF